MNFYEVLVSSQRYHGDVPLTYSSETDLSIGQIVTVPLQNQKVLGVVVTSVDKPKFQTKPAIAVDPYIAIPKELPSLITWLKQYYPAPLGQIVGLILPTTLLQTSRKTKADSTTKTDLKTMPKLNQYQKRVVDDIESTGQRMHLLHGDTGSGKTRIYLELTKKAISSGRSCIILTPEIGLTPQLAKDFENYFGDIVTVLHSTLTPAERRNRWRQVATNQQAQIIIGPRSALFAPVNNVGLIVIDESHDDAYKQEQAPHYQTTRVAAKLAEYHGAKVVLGSATPSVADYFTFEQKKLPIHRLVERAVESEHTSSIEIVNIRDHALFTKSSWLSDKLLGAIRDSLKVGEQSLIFLNRRGSARVVMCSNCGWQATCPRCDLPLTYHGDTHQTHCHTCGYHNRTPSSCPDCKSADIVFKSIGTKAVVQEIERLFPKAHVMRFDGDTGKTDSLATRFEEVKSGEFNIIVGTQILAKGLDLPNLGTVGIVIADTGLVFPDFTAEEKTYQLLTQVIGRADRGHRTTKVIVQAYNPDNETVKQAVAKDYLNFYNSQVKHRSDYHFPPFRYVLKLRFERSTAKSAEYAASQTVDKIRQLGLKLDISAPAPAFVEKMNDKYRWQIIIKAVSRDNLTQVITNLPAKINYDIDPSNLL